MEKTPFFFSSNVSHLHGRRKIGGRIVDVMLDFLGNSETLFLFLFLLGFIFSFSCARVFGSLFCKSIFFSISMCPLVGGIPFIYIVRDSLQNKKFFFEKIILENYLFSS